MIHDALRAAVAKAAAARESADKAQEEMNDLIREAIESPDIRTKEVVEITGLTKARIYQIRDRRR